MFGHAEHTGRAHKWINLWERFRVLIVFILKVCHQWTQLWNHFKLILRGVRVKSSNKRYEIPLWCNRCCLWGQIHWDVSTGAAAYHRSLFCFYHRNVCLVQLHCSHQCHFRTQLLLLCFPLLLVETQNEQKWKLILIYHSVSNNRIHANITSYHSHYFNNTWFRAAHCTGGAALETESMAVAVKFVLAAISLFCLFVQKQDLCIWFIVMQISSLTKL